MDLQNSFALKTYLCQCITIMLFTYLVNRALSVLHPKFEACLPKTCGNGPNISYPFWISGAQESYCGLPNFEITCNDQNPVLTISNDAYLIKDIFYSSSSLLVANYAAYEDTCPTPFHNITLVQTPFKKSFSNIDLLFVYNCNEKPTEYITYPISCASNDTHYSFAAFHKKAFLVNESYSFESCHSFVYAPVDLETAVDLANLCQINYSAILKMGFHMNWTASSCSRCETSGGHCGFDNNEFVCFCRDNPHGKTCDDDEKPAGYWLKIGIGIFAVVMGITITLMVIIICRRKMSSIMSTFHFRNIKKNNQDLEDFIRNYGPLAPKRYNFSEVKKMTNSFKDKLGQGGYGGVYKGKLMDGQFVAVKLLNTSKGNGQEFVNEVVSISKTSHVNVVRLLGFCLERRKKALIYEFMPNGSLEKFIYNEDNLVASQHLRWEKLYQIAIGIARGLEYLHRGCNIKILHFDIKPHNILLDEDFCPKISDFGLAKLCPEKESIVSMLETRGTIGYIAPELYFCRNFGVSHKSDVYSYGMMVLEMVGGRKNLDTGVVSSSEIYFPHWIYRYVELDHEEFRWLGVCTNEEKEIVQKMIIVGLWCIQTRPSNRPSMNKVIDMLQGSIEALKIPPKPFLSSPPRSPIDSTTSLP